MGKVNGCGYLEGKNDYCCIFCRLTTESGLVGVAITAGEHY